MKKILILTTVLALSALVSAALAATPVEGTLVDGKCFVGMGEKGNDHGENGMMKACGEACAKMGIPTGVVTSQGKFYTLIVPAAQVAQFVGQTVRVNGMVKGNSLIADAIEVKDGSSWKRVEIKTMM